MVIIIIIKAIITISFISIILICPIFYLIFILILILIFQSEASAYFLMVTYFQLFFDLFLFMQRFSFILIIIVIAKYLPLNISFFIKYY